MVRAPPGLPCQYSQQCHHYQLVNLSPLSTCHHCQLVSLSTCQLLNILNLSTWPHFQLVNLSTWPHCQPSHQGSHLSLGSIWRAMSPLSQLSPLSACQHVTILSLSTCQLGHLVNLLTREVTLAWAPPGLPCRHCQNCHQYQLFNLSPLSACQHTQLVNLSYFSYSPGKSPWPGLPPACPVCSPPSTFGLFPRSIFPFRYHLSLQPNLCM